MSTGQLAHFAATVLADAGDGGEAKKAGPIGLVVIVLLCVACYFLFKSMSKHLKRVREEFPDVLPADPLHPRNNAAERIEGPDVAESAGMPTAGVPAPGITPAQDDGDA